MNKPNPTSFQMLFWAPTLGLQISAICQNSPKDGELLGLEWGMTLQVSNIINPEAKEVGILRILS